MAAPILPGMPTRRSPARASDIPNKGSVVASSSLSSLDSPRGDKEAETLGFPGPTSLLVAEFTSEKCPSDDGEALEWGLRDVDAEPGLPLLGPGTGMEEYDACNAPDDDDDGDCDRDCDGDCFGARETDWISLCKGDGEGGPDIPYDWDCVSGALLRR